MSKRLSGFTLIELLIVVAIIAILAAIAVPNFLEAQVRSKVSRVKSDHRSLATAIEAYYVDNNSYPAQDTSGSSHYGANALQNAGTALQFVPTFRVKRNANDNLMTLTTPVAYITSFFSDPFADTKGAAFAYSVGVNSSQTNFQNSGWVLWSFGPDTDEATSTISNAGDTGLVAINTVGAIALTFYNPGGQVPTGTMNEVTYDPTNGTTSNGDVYRWKQ